MLKITEWEENSMEELQIFKNEEFGEVRTKVIDGIPMFCLADICKALDITHVTDVKNRLKQDGVVTAEVIDSMGRKQNATFINEANLYKTIFQSRKESAERFTDWVTSDVLPSIRKTGSYSAVQTTPNVPMTYRDAVAQLLESLDREAELQAQLDTSKDWYSIKRVAALNNVSWKTFKWRKLKEVGERMGYAVKKIFDANYGEVNAYHKDVWEAVYPDYEL